MITFRISADEVESVARCPVCDGVRLRELSRVCQRDGVEFLATARCEGCGLVVRHRRPTKAWFSRAFAERERQQAAQGISALNPAIEEERYQRYRRLALALRERTEAGAAGRPAVLDVGCGPGTGLRAFAEVGFSATGIDEDNTRAGHGRALGLAIVATAWENYAPEQRFDVITCLHSIEHFHEPQALLEKMRSWLKPGGRIVIEVPNLAWFVADWTDALYLAHMANYTPATLARLGRLAGFHAVERLRCYDDDRKNRENLCLVFTAETPAAPGPAVGGEEDEPSWESVARLYGTGLAPGLAAPYVFEVPAINDISLGYKNSTRISANLRENLHMRSARLEAGSRRLVVE
ncbi:MAG: class I SAM-dependent methyltransferase [Opitutaceae bacterium]|nr:class I SAM-dependent methyltransferase [Opitutaceae bacterium]